MVLHGAVDEELFHATNGEPYLLFAKFGQYLPQLRGEYVSSDFLKSLEALANRPKGKQRVKELQPRVEARRKAAAAKAGNPNA